MADMYGTVCSNDFKVKDIAKFKMWFEQYHFGDDIELCINKADNSVSFAGHEQSPSAYPRVVDIHEGELIDVDLDAFARELSEHLQDGEVFTVVSGGSEKLRYVACDRLIIAQAYPLKPYYQTFRSDDENEHLLKVILSSGI